VLLIAAGEIIAPPHPRPKRHTSPFARLFTLIKYPTVEFGKIEGFLAMYTTPLK